MGLLSGIARACLVIINIIFLVSDFKDIVIITVYTSILYSQNTVSLSSSSTRQPLTV